MNALVVQNLRDKLQKLISRFNPADEEDTFYFKLAQFWRFFDRQPTFVGIAEALLAQVHGIDDHVDRIFNKYEFVWGETEEQAAAIGYAALRRLAGLGPEAVHKLSFPVGAVLHRDAIPGILEQFLEPFCDYVDEQLDDQRIMLTLLMRYKHRSEWFYRDHP